MIPFLATTASFAGLAILMLTIKPLRNIVRWIFEKIAVVAPAIIGYSFTLQKTDSVIFALLIAVLMIFLAIIITKKPVIKAAIRLCSAGMAICIAFCIFDFQGESLSVSMFLAYLIAYVGIWVVTSTVNIMLDKDESYFNYKMSFDFFATSTVISTLFTYAVLGVHGIFKLPVINDFSLMTQIPLGLVAAASVSFFVIGLFKKLLLFRTFRGVSVPESVINLQVRVNATDYHKVKNNLESLKKAIDRCYDNIEIYSPEEQDNIKKTRKMFYSLCSEFQKTQKWGPTEEVLYTNLKQNYLAYWDKYKKSDNKQSNSQSYKYEQNKNVSQAPLNDISKALALFMFDSLEDVTEEKLKKQRNMLLKAYHPDEGIADDTYSQRINTAYSLIKDCL